MTARAGVAVYIDHHEARIFHVALGSADESALKAPTHHVHRHPKAGLTAEHNHPDDMHHFFADVAKALEGAESILVMGPSTAKLQFVRYLHEHAKTIAPHVVGIETADHPTDRQLMAHVKAYFGDAPPRM